MEKINYQADINKFRENRFQSLRLEEKIESASQDLLKNGLPTHKNEDWKYTAIQNFLPQSLKSSLTNSSTLKDNDLTKTNSNFYNLNIINGKLIRNGLEELSELTISTFDKSSNADHFPEGEELDYFVQTDSEKFNQLNLATFSEGIIITIHKNCQLDKPICLNHFVDSKNGYSNTRILFIAQAFSKANIIENFYFEDTKVFNNSVTKILAHPGAKVNYFNKCQNSKQATQVMNFDSVLKRDAQLNTYYLCEGTKLVRNNININLSEENANAQLTGLYSSKDEEHNDYFVTVNHQKSHTYSNQLFKGILNDRSRGVFTGKVIVHRDAQQVDSQQLNKNILLSKTSHVDTRPQLEVYADDVKCAHGATIGQLDPEELFYLESRGISKQRAFNLLCEGFANEVFETIEDHSLKNYFTKLVEDSLERTAYNV